MDVTPNFSCLIFYVDLCLQKNEGKRPTTEEKQRAKEWYSKGFKQLRTEAKTERKKYVLIVIIYSENFGNTNTIFASPTLN